ncbi:MAG: alpha-L-fucosidase [Phycisphaerae bacterium]|nr:alpha-L-fucosidase [Phycisphaerae bacterium]
MRQLCLLAPAVLVACQSAPQGAAPPDAAQPHAAPPPAASLPDKPYMEWWRDARFGMFIHWGLYAVPAGKYGDRTDHAEWIRTSAQIPLAEYDKYLAQFNPVNFDADAWVRLAKDAGVGYIVITSKHHDGFCLFDSAHTDFDVMATPFKRDILKELAAACAAHGIRMCWYHSIMDWHHPDYLPRREWETPAMRPTTGADFNRYVAYMKAQLKELLTNYGPIGVLWFDGQWEGTWTHERGLDLDRYVRSLQPGIIINNRVDKGGGEYGLTKPGFAGDYGTPEQEIPPTGVPHADWETCMTMNDHWGYNAADTNYKSSRDLIRKLADIASKGGNFLLNVGPTALGEIPQPSVQRLHAIGQWMRVNGESIRGTFAGPFPALPWGRCTQKPIPGGTRLYLHVFDWPADGRLVVPGILNEPLGARVLATGRAGAAAAVSRDGDALVIAVPAASPDPDNSVIALDIKGRPDVTSPPTITSPAPVFVGSTDVRIASDRDSVDLRYTTDGSEPTHTSPRATSPVRLTATTTVAARAFRGERAVSPVARATFTKADPWTAKAVARPQPGLRLRAYEIELESLPDLGSLPHASARVVPTIGVDARPRDYRYALRFDGFIRVPDDAAYTFTLNSDDGSRLFIDGRLVVDNDGLHSLRERSGVAPLAAGLHAIVVEFFERTGGDGLELFWAWRDLPRRAVPASALLHDAQPTP